VDVDLAIIGGGPAGLACAWRAADLGLRTILCEPKTGVVEKACGEGIMPGALEILDAIGVPHHALVCREFPGIRYQIDGARPLNIDFPQAGRAYRRPVLDRLLRERVLASPLIDLIPEKARCENRGDHVLVQTASRHLIRAPFLVAADGAAGRTASWLRGPARLEGSRLGLRARFQAARILDRVEIHLGHGTDFYLTPLPGGLVNVALLLEQEPEGAQGAEAMLAWALARHPAVCNSLGQEDTPALSTPLQHAYPQQVCSEQVFLIGDAGGIADPILGTGVAVALRTGFQAAESVAALAAGEEAALVCRRFRRQAHEERIPRRRLAQLLHFASTHERVTRSVIAVLHRTPRLASRLAATAAGMRPGAAVASR